MKINKKSDIQLLIIIYIFSIAFNLINTLKTRVENKNTKYSTTAFSELNTEIKNLILSSNHVENEDEMTENLLSNSFKNRLNSNTLRKGQLNGEKREASEDDEIIESKSGSYDDFDSGEDNFYKTPQVQSRVENENKNETQDPLRGRDSKKFQKETKITTTDDGNILKIAEFNVECPAGHALEGYHLFGESHVFSSNKIGMEYNCQQNYAITNTRIPRTSKPVKIDKSKKNDSILSLAKKDLNIECKINEAIAGFQFLSVGENLSVKVICAMTTLGNCVTKDSEEFNIRTKFVGNRCINQLSQFFIQSQPTNVLNKIVAVKISEDRMLFRVTSCQLGGSGKKNEENNKKEDPKIPSVGKEVKQQNIVGEKKNVTQLPVTPKIPVVSSLNNNNKASSVDKTKSQSIIDLTKVGKTQKLPHGTFSTPKNLKDWELIVQKLEDRLKELQKHKEELVKKKSDLEKTKLESEKLSKDKVSVPRKMELMKKIDTSEVEAKKLQTLINKLNQDILDIEIQLRRLRNNKPGDKKSSDKNNNQTQNPVNTIPLAGIPSNIPTVLGPNGEIMKRNTEIDPPIIPNNNILNTNPLNNVSILQNPLINTKSTVSNQSNIPVSSNVIPSQINQTPVNTNNNLNISNNSIMIPGISPKLPGVIPNNPGILQNNIRQNANVNVIPNVANNIKAISKAEDKDSGNLGIDSKSPDVSKDTIVQALKDDAGKNGGNGINNRNILPNVKPESIDDRLKFKNSFCSQHCTSDVGKLAKKCYYEGSVKPCNSCKLNRTQINEKDKKIEIICTQLCNIVDKTPSCLYFGWINRSKKPVDPQILLEFGFKREIKKSP